MEFKITDIQNFLGDRYRLHGDVVKLYGESDLNYLFVSTDGKKYILKIASPQKSESLLQGENRLLDFLDQQKKSFVTPVPVTDRSGKTVCRLSEIFKPFKWGRLLSWIEGVLWSGVPYKSARTLYSLGHSLGQLTGCLQEFDHPAAHRDFRWDVLHASWVGDKSYFNADQQVIIDYFMHRYKTKVRRQCENIRKSVVYNDANDHNLLLTLPDGQDYQISGIIDFGDFVYTATISELAVGITYAVLDLPDPLEAARVIIKGYHHAFALEEEEVEVLYDLIAMRLLISVTISAENAFSSPLNGYLQISSRPAWDLLKKWIGIQPSYAHCHFRYACGWEASPAGKSFKQFLKDNRLDFFPVLGRESLKLNFKVLDISAESSSLGNHRNYSDPKLFRIWMNEQVPIGTIGIGRYLEPRPIYRENQDKLRGNFGIKWRTIHLGIDFFVAEKQIVYAVWDGEIQSIVISDRLLTCNIVIRHELSEGAGFYTFYKNLNRDSTADFVQGQKIQKGSVLGVVGASPGKEKLRSHLHFQVLLDPLHDVSCIPVRCTREELGIYASVCPWPGEICGIELPKSTYTYASDDQLISMREQVLGPNLTLSYKKPLHMVRGEMQFLIDNTGRRFLDLVNNVAHVGHENPRVVRAGQDQMALLNTNTRYLHQTVLSFGKKLLTYLPSNFEVVYVVNSGSEANELALRMARACTGRSEMLVMEQGYHGNTSGCVDLSSYKFDGPGGAGAPSWVHVVPLPDIFRSKKKLSEEDLGKQYASDVSKEISRLISSNKRLAGFIAEPVLGCAGQVAPPTGYYKRVYESVRQGGGICIADEVQTGCGRMGSHFWAFEMHGVIPDIVTIGKPIGNGHPLGVVVTTREIAQAFDNGMEYFNTFGGNPVSSRIGLEVLNIIEWEDLVSNANKIGTFLLEELDSIQKMFPVVGNVRGSGLFIGIELVEDPVNLEPNPRAAEYVINRMKEYCILLSTDGPHRNVIKIKPPLVITREDATFFIEIFNSVLMEFPC